MYNINLYYNSHSIASIINSINVVTLLELIYNWHL